MYNPASELGVTVTRTLVAFDVETYLTAPGDLAPRLVAGAFIFQSGEAELWLADDFLERFRALAADPSVHFIAHNAKFDCAVIMRNGGQEFVDLIFSLYTEQRMHCTLVREKMRRLPLGALTVYKGKRSLFNLAALVHDYLGRDISETKKGDDVWRLRYSELDGVPIEDWPEEAVTYIVDDVYLCLNVFLEQEAAGLADLDPRAEAAQVGADLALYMMTVEGIPTDVARARSIEQTLSTVVDRANEALLDSGLKSRVKKKGELVFKKNMAAIRDRLSSDGCELMFTEKGAISTSAEALGRARDPALRILAGISKAEKLLGTYIPALLQGRVHASFNVLLNTNRTSSNRPNIQNLPRHGGIRECFLPPEGYLLVSIDFDTLELRSWAQVCLDRLGFSRMAEALNAGQDPHAILGADLLGTDYDQFRTMLKSENPEEKTQAKDHRQWAKGINFGKPGGLGDATTQLYLHRMGIDLGMEQIAFLGATWLQTWPEAKPYFRTVSNALPYGRDHAPVEIPGSFGLVRGRATYTASCNTPFQGLAASGGKLCLFRVAKACYTDRNSPAFGSIPLAWIHDELLAAVPIGQASEAAFALRDIMVEAMSEVIPDVRITAMPALMDRWYKAAEPIVDADGRLVCWHPALTGDDKEVSAVISSVADLLLSEHADVEETGSDEEGSDDE